MLLLCVLPVCRVSNVTEGVGTLSVEVVREAGTFGAVSVFYLVTSLTAMADEDFASDIPKVSE